MPRIKNISPLGALEVPLLHRVIEAGETIDVREDHARVLLLQSDVYEPADKAAKTIAADLAAEQTASEGETPGGNEQDAGEAAGDAEGKGEEQ